jgi:DNA polymerase III subunit delta
LILQYSQILSNLKKKIFHPVYLLYGEEPFYIDKVSDFIEENALTESEKAFNQTILYGKDTDAGQLLEVVRRLPMMANFQLVIVKEAQQLRDMETLENYLKQPVKSTILVFAYKHKNIDKRKKFWKDLIAHEHVVAMESAPLKDYQAKEWIDKYLAAENIGINPKGSEMLAEYLGTDMSKIVHEIEKLILIKGKGGTITEADIEKNIGVSREYNIFEFTNALGERDILKAGKIIKYFSLNPKSLVFQLAIGNVFSFFSKVYLAKLSPMASDAELGSLLSLNPFIAKNYKAYAAKYSFQQLEYIFEQIELYDLKSKGMGATGDISDAELLKELTLKIFAGPVKVYG